MGKIKIDGNEVNIQGDLKKEDILALKDINHIDMLSLSKCSKLKTSIAREINNLHSIKRLWLWCKVTRPALNQVVLTPDLEVLDVLNVIRAGRLSGFSKAEKLTELRCNCWLSKDDLLAISKCKSLQELGAQHSKLSPKVIEAFLKMPKLTSLDIEDSNFDDNLAGQISESSQFLSLDVGNTSLTGKGLKHICKMKQLERLDLWASHINEEDIELLPELPNLKYLSIGGHIGNKNFNSKTLIPKLAAIQSLERIWLDGVKLTTMEKTKLEEKYKHVQITYEEDLI